MLSDQLSERLWEPMRLMSRRFGSSKWVPERVKSRSQEVIYFVGDVLTSLTNFGAVSLGVSGIKSAHGSENAGAGQPDFIFK